MLSERETCRCQSCMRSDPFRNVSRLFYGVAEQQALGNHTYPLSSGVIARYVSSTKELDHDRHTAGRSVA